jgi:hypothetical protein
MIVYSRKCKKCLGWYSVDEDVDYFEFMCDECEEMMKK